MAPEQASDAAEPDLNERLWGELLAGVQVDTGEAARAHLEAGRSIYYSEDDTPEGLLIKKLPDGHRELVRFDPSGDVFVGQP